MENTKPIVADELRESIQTELLAKRIFTFEKLSSTNNFAKRLVKHGEPEGTLIVANHQTKGRGRQEKKWYAPPNMGLWFSIILIPKQPIDKFGLISLFAAVAIAKAIEKLTYLKPDLKWPNDVLLGRKKVSGILIESQLSNNYESSLVLGIGINVNQLQADFPDEIQLFATSLREQYHKKVDRVALLIELLANLEHFYLEFEAGNWAYILSEWKKRCPSLNRKVKTVQNGRAIIGTFEDLNQTGRMGLRLDTGELMWISVDESLSAGKGEQCYL